MYCTPIRSHLIISRAIGLILCTALLAAMSFSQATGAVPDESAYYKLLKNKYDISADLYAGALIQELRIFRDLYPGSARPDSVEYLLAMLSEQEKMEDEALAGFLKIVYVYPSSDLIPECLEHLKLLGKKKRKGITSIFKDRNTDLLKTHALRIVDEKLTFAGGERGWVDYLGLLDDAAVKKLTHYTAHECRHYLYRLGYDEAKARVMLISGNMFRLGEQWRRAILSYRTAELLDPYGDDVGQALLYIGDIYLHDLENYRMARDLYHEVIEKFPAETVAARASVSLADVDMAEEAYGQAVVQLEDTARRFPFPEIRMECYMRIGEIYLEDMDNVQKAVSFYERLVQEYPTQNRAAEVLIRIGQVHEKKTKKYEAAVAAYKRLFELFPDNPLTPQYLLKAADLAGDRLDDEAAALDLYSLVAKNYPVSEPGKKAVKVLEKKNNR